jgi:hypothetical protein
VVVTLLARHFEPVEESRVVRTAAATHTHDEDVI